MCFNSLNAKVAIYRNQSICLFIFGVCFFNPLSANPEKWSNTLKQIVGNLPTICLSVFDHFMNLALKGLMIINRWGKMKDSDSKEISERKRSVTNSVSLIRC